VKVLVAGFLGGSLAQPSGAGWRSSCQKLHAVAKMISASTDRISPIIIIAPTIVHSCVVLRSPSLLEE